MGDGMIKQKGCDIKKFGLDLDKVKMIKYLILSDYEVWKGSQLIAGIPEGRQHASLVI